MIRIQHVPQSVLDASAVLDANDALPVKQQVVAVALAVTILIVVVELIRKRKLREEYSILWVATALALIALAVDTDLLIWFQNAVGAVLPASALFFGALLFLMLVSLQYSVRLSKLTARNKTLCQKIALLERDVDELRREVRGEARAAEPQATVNDESTEAPRRERERAEAS